MTNTPIILLGAGGHAAVLAELALRLGKNILGVVAPTESTLKGFPDIAYLGCDAAIEKYSPMEVKLVNGIGTVSVIKNNERRKIFEHFKQRGYSFDTLIHPSVILASNVNVGEGVQIMAGVIIQPNVKIDSNTIINTGACVDHDCQIGHSVHVAPNVTLSGNVLIGENAFIGVGSVLIQGIHVDDNAMICAGMVVTKHVATKVGA